MISWVRASNGHIPSGGLVGGKDHGDQDIVVVRAWHGGDILPGKLIGSHGCCYVPYDGKEHPKTDYEVLVASSSTFKWVRVTGGSMPGFVVPGGATSSGEILYVGRVGHNGTLTVGKVQPSHGVCYISYGGEELKYSSYEVLVHDINQ